MEDLVKHCACGLEKTVRLRTNSEGRPRKQYECKPCESKRNRTRYRHQFVVSSDVDQRLILRVLKVVKFAATRNERRKHKLINKLKGLAVARTKENA